VPRSLVPVILFGGSGSRLWPMSRKLLPKQFLPLVTERSLLQDTALRLRGLKGAGAPLVVANNEHRFLAAEHAAWEPARLVGAQTHALLDSLRERRLLTGLVSNAFDPGWLLHEDLARMGLAERLDAAVFSSEVGMRKPHPAIFEEVLSRLGVGAGEALFVGDRRYEDMRGAKELGMTTVLALWFRADDDERGAEPDFEAFTPMDVLNVVRRLTGELP